MARLLVIAGNPASTVEQLRQAFPAPAHAVSEADTGKEGLERVHDSPPDVVLLDEQLPDHSGLEICRAIRRIDSRIPVIFITPERTADTAIEAMRVARAIHRHGPRAKAPFLAINCAAIPENLLESELFGHEKSAYTGADCRIGKFEQFSGGTILLDEIGDMPLGLQAKVLRLVQDQTFQRLGGNETVRTDVRLIATTHRDLKALSVEGTFRPDLYYRLGVFGIQMPPLRGRNGDIETE